MYLNPIFVVVLGNVTQIIGLGKFFNKQKKDEKPNKKQSILTKARSSSKRNLMRSLSSVFKQEEENNLSNGGNSMTIDNGEEESATGSFLMPNEDKQSLPKMAKSMKKIIIKR